MSVGSERPDVSALLRAQHAVAAALASSASASPEDAIAAVLPVVAKPLGAVAACVWEPYDGALRCARVWAAPGFDGSAFEAACRATTLAAGEGLPGAVLASGRPCRRVVNGPDRLYVAAAATAGLDSAVGVPLLGASAPVGAIEYFVAGDAELDDELAETLASLGAQIGLRLERAAVEADLRRSDAVMRAVLNAAFDAIVTMDAAGTIVGVNPAAEALFDRPASEMLGRELAATIIPPALRDAHRQGLEAHVASGAERVMGHPLELRAMRADGTEFPVEVAIRRLDVPGPPVFTGFIRDLTAQRAAEQEVRLLAEEQAALRRVATLVARGADQATVFAAVTEAVARLTRAQTANMIRYRPDDTALVIGAWSDGDAPNIALGAVVPLDGDTVGPRIRRTGRPVRVDTYEPGDGRLDASLRELGFTSAIGAPVVLDDELWGAVIVRSAAGPFPPRAEHRLRAFAELAAQALANADAREQLAASRARLVTEGMAERRRLERNLHDGAQQRLVALALMLGIARREVERDPVRARGRLDAAEAELAAALSELREIARGLHPAVLTDHGLDVAIRSICGRAPVPVEIEVDVPQTPGEAVQAAAYYVTAEALTNIARYARATSARVEVRASDGVLTVDVRDDGVGGAQRHPGSGLSGLVDRVEALGGTLRIDSPPGRGTWIRAELPA